MRVCTASKMQQQLDVIRHRIDTELTRARLAGKAYGQKLNISQTVGELIDILNKLYRDRGAWYCHIDSSRSHLCRRQTGYAGAVW